MAKPMLTWCAHTVVAMHAVLFIYSCSARHEQTVPPIELTEVVPVVGGDARHEARISTGRACVWSRAMKHFGNKPKLTFNVDFVNKIQCRFRCS